MRRAKAAGQRADRATTKADGQRAGRATTIACAQ